MENIELVVAFLLTISLASERMVTILKTAIPALAGQGDPNSGWNLRWRPLIIQVLTFGFCCAVVAMMTPQGLGANWLTGSVTIGNDLELRIAVVGLLASGGSAFWNNVLGYTKAVKDIKKDLVETAAKLKTETEAAAAGKMRAPEKFIGAPADQPAGV